MSSRRFARSPLYTGVSSASSPPVMQPCFLRGSCFPSLLTLVLTALSLLGRPLAWRLLAALIVGNTVHLGYRYTMVNAISTPFLAIVILFAIYLCVGAVKLWRMADVQSQGGSHA